MSWQKGLLTSGSLLRQHVQTGNLHNCQQSTIQLLSAVRHVFTTLCRHKSSDGASQFWWQQKPQDAKSGYMHSNKRALFPVHVLEYSDNGIETSGRTPLSPEASLAAAAEYQPSSKETAHLHSKGNERHLLPDVLMTVHLHVQNYQAPDPPVISHVILFGDTPCMLLSLCLMLAYTPGTAMQALQRLAASNPMLYKALLHMRKDSHGRISAATLMQVSCNVVQRVPKKKETQVCTEAKGQNALMAATLHMHERLSPVSFT